MDVFYFPITKNMICFSFSGTHAWGKSCTQVLFPARFSSRIGNGAVVYAVAHSSVPLLRPVVEVVPVVAGADPVVVGRGVVGLASGPLVFELTPLPTCLHIAGRFKVHGDVFC